MLETTFNMHPLRRLVHSACETISDIAWYRNVWIGSSLQGVYIYAFAWILSYRREVMNLNGALLVRNDKDYTGYAHYVFAETKLFQSKTGFWHYLRSQFSQMKDMGQPEYHQGKMTASDDILNKQ